MMAKDQKIIVEFDKDLVGDVTGTNPPLATTPVNIAQGNTGMASSQYSSSYTASNAFNGNTSDYWRPSSSTMPQWVGCDLGAQYLIYGISVYLNSYRPANFELQGSDDNATWNTILDSTFADTAGWQDFNFTSVSYRYFRLYVKTLRSTYLYIYEFKLMYNSPIGNERAFTVTGYQKNPLVIGTLQQKTYGLLSVQRWDGSFEQKYLQLNIDPLNRFNNAEGNLTVSYNQALGNLSGEKNVIVAAFINDFLPVDLVPTPVGFETEKIALAVSVANFAFTHINKSSMYEPAEKVAVNSSVSITLRNIITDPL
jgi:hypothetical protein